MVTGWEDEILNQHPYTVFKTIWYGIYISRSRETLIVVTYAFVLKVLTEPVLTEAENPTIQNCPINETHETNRGQPTAVVTWPDLETTDNSGQTPTVTCSVEPGSQFETG